MPYTKKEWDDAVSNSQTNRWYKRLEDIKDDAESKGIHMGVGDSFFLNILYREELGLLMGTESEEIMAKEGNDIKRIAMDTAYHHLFLKELKRSYNKE